MILGLEWLKANKIVVDMSEHSITAKDSGFVLLNFVSILLPQPPTYSPLRNRTSPVKSCGDDNIPLAVVVPNIKGSTCNIVRDHQLVSAHACALMTASHLELQHAICWVPSHNSHVMSFAMLCSCIASLASQASHLQNFHAAECQLKMEFKDISINACSATTGIALPSDSSASKLAQHDLNIKAKFHNLFPKYLPHVNTLPSNIRHHIIITAVEKICNSQEYSEGQKGCNVCKSCKDTVIA
jgi:hypothetical protein